MRHCKNEGVEVYEAAGDNLGDLLRDAAKFIDETDSYVKVDTAYNMAEGGYIVTVYVHG